jgi:hypothetical protein
MGDNNGDNHYNDHPTMWDDDDDDATTSGKRGLDLGKPKLF